MYSRCGASSLNSTADNVLLKRFSLFDSPAIVFFAKGRSSEVNRVIGFQNAEKFFARVELCGGSIKRVYLFTNTLSVAERIYLFVNLLSV